MVDVSMATAVHGQRVCSSAFCPSRDLVSVRKDTPLRVRRRPKRMRSLIGHTAHTRFPPITRRLLTTSTVLGIVVLERTHARHGAEGVLGLVANGADTTSDGANAANGSTADTSHDTGGAAGNTTDTLADHVDTVGPDVDDALAGASHASTNTGTNADDALAERLGSAKDALEATLLGARDLSLLLGSSLGVKALCVSVDAILWEALGRLDGLVGYGEVLVACIQHQNPGH